MPKTTLTHAELFERVRYDERGLVPVIVQDSATSEVLMMAWVNREALRRTLQLGEMVYWSRSRREYWHKGASSGNVQRLMELRLDCDGDTLLALVDPAGPACHTGEISCFYRATSLLPEGDNAAHS